MGTEVYAFAHIFCFVVYVQLTPAGSRSDNYGGCNKHFATLYIDTLFFFVKIDVVEFAVFEDVDRITTDVRT